MSVIPTIEDLKDEAGKRAFIVRAMTDPYLTKEYPEEKQRLALVNYDYKVSKEKSNRTLVAYKINQEAVNHAIFKIKLNYLIETKEFKEPTQEICANYLEKNGDKKFGSWFLAVDENSGKFIHPFSSDFQNVDIAALENIMEVAASVNDKDLANKASDLLTLALKKKNGENLSTFTFFSGPNSVTLEASI